MDTVLGRHKRHLGLHVTISLNAQSNKHWTSLSSEGDFTFIVCTFTFLGYSTYSIQIIPQNPTVKKICKAWTNRCHPK